MRIKGALFGCYWRISHLAERYKFYDDIIVTISKCRSCWTLASLSQRSTKAMSHLTLSFYSDATSFSSSIHCSVVSRPETLYVKRWRKNCAVLAARQVWVCGVAVLTRQLSEISHPISQSFGGVGGGVNMFSKCLQEDPPLQLSPLSALHLLSANSFLFPSCTGGKSLEMSGGFIALLEILTNNYSTLQGRLATACWVKQLHRYYNVRAIHFFGAECVCLLPSFSLSVALSQPPHVSEVHIILVKRLSPV